MSRRPKIPQFCSPPLSQLIQSCWHQRPDMRPSFSNIILTIDALAFNPKCDTFKNYRPNQAKKKLTRAACVDENNDIHIDTKNNKNGKGLKNTQKTSNTSMNSKVPPHSEPCQKADKAESTTDDFHFSKNETSNENSVAQGCTYTINVQTLETIKRPAIESPQSITSSAPSPAPITPPVDSETSTLQTDTNAEASSFESTNDLTKSSLNQSTDQKSNSDFKNTVNEPTENDMDNTEVYNNDIKDKEKTEINADNDKIDDTVSITSNLDTEYMLDNQIEDVFPPPPPSLLFGLLEQVNTSTEKDGMWSPPPTTNTI